MKYLKMHFVLIGIILLYLFLVLSAISFGTPNENHPFTYHMDEWHFLHSVRAVFKYGTTTIEGAGNIPFFHVLSTAVFLIPFILTGIIHPFSLHSSLSNLTQWQSLFEVLRLHTLLYGVFSIFAFYFLVKEFVRTNPIIPIIIYVFTPIFLMLSNYYKYDITLLFWIILSTYFSLKYAHSTQKKYFFLACAAVGFSMATKFSALPLVGSLILLFLLFTKLSKSSIRTGLVGLTIFGVIFLFFGIPDLLIGKGNYFELLDSNLSRAPHASNYFIAPYPVFMYLIKDIYPILFGHVLFYLELFAIFFMLFILIKDRAEYRKTRYKIRLFIFLTAMLFALSLAVLQIYATGNRVLVLLPYLILILTDIAAILWKSYKYTHKIFIFVIVIVLVMHIFEAFVWASIKVSEDVRQTSSIWAIQHIPKNTEIGLQNIPIYQEIPNLFLKEFYLSQGDRNIVTRYRYRVIDGSEKTLPPVVVVTNTEEIYQFTNSTKIKLLSRLHKEKYKIAISFPAKWSIMTLVAQPKDLSHAALVPQESITIYIKK